jgi:hypothetical protein
MKYHELTNEMIDKKILDFQKKNPNLIGHNLYYAITVNEDDTIGEERYGANLLTNRGFRQQYFTATSGPDGGEVWVSGYVRNVVTPSGNTPEWYQSTWLLIGTGYTDDNGLTYTGAPKLTDQCMDEYAGRANECSYKDVLSIIETGYDKRGTTNNGFIYTTACVGKAMFDYQHRLPTTSIAGHTGGTPDDETVDTRWQQDPLDGSWYFNITEVGGCSYCYYWSQGDDGFTVNDPGFMYEQSDGTSTTNYGPIYWNTSYPERNENTKDFSKRNIAYHFLLVDQNNQPSPIKKRQNQKLYIYTYLTLTLPEKLMTDLWEDKKYLLLNPTGHNKALNKESNSRNIWGGTIYVCPVSGNMRSEAWANQNPITNFWRTDSGDASYLNKYEGIYDYGITEEGGGYPWDSNPYGTDDGVSVTYQFTTTPKLMEDKWCFISHFVFGNGYSQELYPASITNNNIIYDFTQECWLTTFDELDEPETITTDIYCNSTIDLHFSDQFGLAANVTNKDGLMPITHIENGSSVTTAYLFDYDTKEYDIPVDVTIPSYYYGGWRTFVEHTYLKNFICKDNVKRDVLCYFNPFAHKDGDTNYDGAFPGMIISSFNMTNVQLFAADKYWDTSTWIQFIGLDDTSTQKDPSNNQLLVQKKYFVMYVPSDTKNRIMNVTFKEECLPKVIPHTDVTYLTKDNEPLTIERNSIVEMIGNDEYKYFTIGNYVIKMKGQPGKDSQNTLECDKKYFIQHDKLFGSLNHSRIANGKNIMYRFRPYYDSNSYSYTQPIAFLTCQDITQESTIPGYDSTCGSLKNHFFGPKYPTIDAYEDHNNRFMILSTNTISNSTEYFDDEGNALTNYPACITIFDTNIDVESRYPATESNIKSMLERKGMGTEWRSAVNNSSNYYGRNQWVMKDEEYLEIEPGDCVMVFNQFYSNTYPDGAEWCGIVYDENHNILHDIKLRYAPYVITHPNAKYMKVAMARINDMDATIRDVWYTKNKNYGKDCPCIKNAKHGIVIKGSSNKMIYNDISEGVELQHWNVIDMADPIDGNGDPKVIDSFEIDPNFIGGTYVGGIGFSHYAYIRMNDKNNIYSFWLYDLNDQSLTQLLATWKGFDDSTKNRHACFVANDDVLCYCGAINSNTITNDSNNYGSAIYCISADDPTTRHALYSYTPCFTSLQLKTVNWGTSENPKNQLLLAAYSYNTTRSSLTYDYAPKIVLDVGKWLQTKSWEDGEPDGFFNTGDIGGNGAYVYCYIYDKGVIGLCDGKTSAQTSQLGYRPLENYLPMQITVQSKTINSFNNPLQINEKTYTFTRSNNLEHLGYGTN